MELSEPMAIILAAILTAGSSLATLLATRSLNKKDLEKKEAIHQEDIKKIEGEVERKVDLEVEKRIEVFDPPSDGSYNKAFYKYFEAKIESAKECIYITGDGFDFKTKEGSIIAESFNSKIKAALRRNIEVVRVQIKPNSSEEWIKMVSDLVEEFPKNFKFYFLQRGKKTQISSICVIDPDNEESNVSEIMLSTTKVRGVDRDSVAGTGIFIEGKKQLASSFRNGVLSLIDDSIQLKTSEEVKKYLLGSIQSVEN